MNGTASTFVYDVYEIQETGKAGTIYIPCRTISGGSPEPSRSLTMVWPLLATGASEEAMTPSAARGGAW